MPNEVITKEMLRKAPTAHHATILKKRLDDICEMVMRIAKRGDETYFVYYITEASLSAHREMAPYDYFPSIEDLVTGLSKRFEEGMVKRIAEGILINWS